MLTDKYVHFGIISPLTGTRLKLRASALLSHLQVVVITVTSQHASGAGFDMLAAIGYVETLSRLNNNNP